MRTARSLVALLLLGAAASCAELGPLQADTCGNGVKEGKEDCDGAPLESTLGSYCGAYDSEDRTKACRLLCGAASGITPEPVCPKGWECSPDGICRVWSGEFDAALSFEADVQQIAAADFDGDQRDEVLAIGSSELTVHYIEDEARVLTTRVGAADQFPAVGDLQDTKRRQEAQDTGEEPVEPEKATTDLVLTLGPGVSALLGNEDRKLKPVVYPWASESVDDVRLVALEQDIQRPGDEVVAVTRTEVTTAGGGLLLDITPYGLEISLEQPIATGQLYGDDCEAMILSVGPPGKRADSLFIFDRCANVEIPVEVGKVLATNAKTEIASPVRVIDVNGDDFADLAVAVALDGPSSAKRFYLMYVPGPFDLVTPGSYCLQGFIGAGTFSSLCSAPAAPLALGDLDKDHILDAVEPCGIHLSALDDGATTSCVTVDDSRRVPVAVFNPGAPWSTAVIAELTHDEHMDIVAGSSSSAGVTFFRGTSGLALDHAEIPTLRSIKELAIGDFDGDQIDDIVLREGEDDEDGAPVSIAFGRAMSVPEPPVELSRIPRAEHLCVGDLVSNSLIADNMNDIAVVQRDAADEHRVEVALFAGDASRRIQSAFGFPGDDTTGSSVRVPRKVVLGRFRSVDGAYPLGIGALVFAASSEDNDGSKGGSSEMWFAPVDPADGSLATPGSLQSNPTLLVRDGVEGKGLPAILLHTAQMASLDLGNGSDALVVAALNNLEQPVLFVMPPCDADPCDVLPAVPLEAEGPTPGSSGMTRIDQLGVAADSKDIAVLISSLGETPPTPDDTLGAWPASRIMLVRNEGLDTLGQRMTMVTALDLRAASAAEGDKEADSTITAFAWLNVDAEQDLELLVLTRDSLYCAKRMPDFTVQPCGGALSLPSGGGTALAVGDVNGDGLKDLVIGDEGQFRVHLATADNR